MVIHSAHNGKLWVQIPLGLPCAFSTMVKILLTSLNLYQIRFFYKTFIFHFTMSKFVLLQALLLKLQNDINTGIPYLTFFPTTTKIFTVLRSPHVHKKSREQFEMKIFKASITLTNTLNTAYSFSRLNLQKIFKFVQWFRAVNVMYLTSNKYSFFKFSNMITGKRNQKIERGLRIVGEGGYKCAGAGSYFFFYDFFPDEPKKNPEVVHAENYNTDLSGIFDNIYIIGGVMAACLAFYGLAQYYMTNREAINQHIEALEEIKAALAETKAALAKVRAEEKAEAAAKFFKHTMKLIKKSQKFVKKCRQPDPSKLPEFDPSEVGNDVPDIASMLSTYYNNALNLAGRGLSKLIKNNEATADLSNVGSSFKQNFAEPLAQRFQLVENPVEVIVKTVPNSVDIVQVSVKPSNVILEAADLATRTNADGTITLFDSGFAPSLLPLKTYLDFTTVQYHRLVCEYYYRAVKGWDLTAMNQEMIMAQLDWVVHDISMRIAKATHQFALNSNQVVDCVVAYNPVKMANKKIIQRLLDEVMRSNPNIVIDEIGKKMLETIAYNIDQSYAHVVIDEPTQKALESASGTQSNTIVNTPSASDAVINEAPLDLSTLAKKAIESIDTFGHQLRAKYFSNAPVDEATRRYIDRFNASFNTPNKAPSSAGRSSPSFDTSSSSMTTSRRSSPSFDTSSSSSSSSSAGRSSPSFDTSSSSMTTSRRSSPSFQTSDNFISDVGENISVLKFKTSFYDILVSVYDHFFSFGSNYLASLRCLLSAFFKICDIILAGGTEFGKSSEFSIFDNLVVEGCHVGVPYDFILALF